MAGRPLLSRLHTHKGGDSGGQFPVLAAAFSTLSGRRFRP